MGQKANNKDQQKIKEMKTTERFEKAVTKLYTAFHNDELDAMDCEACAVGNICDNTSSWQDFRSMTVGKKDMFHYLSNIGDAKLLKTQTGYSVSELLNIERVFLVAHGTKSLKLQKLAPINSKEYQFKGLCAVIEYLCELDGIENIMEIQSLFEERNDEKLSRILI